MDDAARIRGLRTMKGAAVALLLVAAVVFLVARAQHGDPPVWGYIEAGAEAAMVGALADWFAVTALFRRPLGLPIPHTAIIATRKDRIGQALGEFVQGNFLSREAVGERMRDAQVAARVGEWLTQPDNARRGADAAVDALGGALRVLDDREVRAGLERLVELRIRAMALSSLAGRAIASGVEAGHHQRLLDATITALRRFLVDNRTVLRARLDQESPWWVPGAIDDRVFAKLDTGLHRFLDDVERDPAHELRVAFEQRALAFAERMRTDPGLRAQGEKLTEELLAHPDVRAWLSSLWDQVDAGLTDAVARPDSDLRRRAAVTLVRLGERIGTDAELRGRVDAALEQFAGYVVDSYRAEVTHLIASTIRRWDPATTSRKLELQVGRDLQFIRINGTVVGAIAGVAIHGIAQLLF